MVFAELKVLGTVLVALSTANVFFEFDKGAIGLHENFILMGPNSEVEGCKSGRLMYDGNGDGVFKISITTSHSSDSEGLFFGEIRVNGEPASLPVSLQQFGKHKTLLGVEDESESAHFETLAYLSPGDFVSFWSKSTEGDPILLRDFTMTVTPVTLFEEEIIVDFVPD
jgi:hypothetical protein